MFYSLSHLRNACAHHSRVWNRDFTMKVYRYKKYEEIYGTERDTSLYAYMVTIQILLKKINPTSSWLDRIEELITKYDIAIYRMGFPKDWKEKLLTIK